MSSGQKFVARLPFCYVVSETLSDPSTEGAMQPMANVNRRQWERFAYPSELQLTADGHALPATLVDLSQRGMQVLVPIKLRVGDVVHAALPVREPALAATARVCWAVADRTGGIPRTRAGLAFELLPPAAEQQLLASALARASGSVTVRFPGSDALVSARRTATEHGFQLSFGLPFLREGAVLTLQPSEAGSQAERTQVVRSRVYVGGPDTEAWVELVVQPCTEARKRRFVQYDTQQASLPVPSDSTPANDADELVVPKQRVFRRLGVGAALVAALWLVARWGQPGAADVSKSQQAAVAPPQLEAADGSSLETSQPMAAAETEQDEGSSGAEGRADEEVHSTADGAAAPATPPPTPALAATPIITTTKDTTEIFVPTIGSLSGLTTKQWTNPPAVVVELPRGHVALAKKHYDIAAHGVVGLSVGRPGGVTQLRVYVNSILSQYDASAAPGRLLVRIQRDLQSLP
jgi:hypothetical protein